MTDTKTVSTYSAFDLLHGTVPVGTTWKRRDFTEVFAREGGHLDRPSDEEMDLLIQFLESVGIDPTLAEFFEPLDVMDSLNSTMTDVDVLGREMDDIFHVDPALYVDQIVVLDGPDADPVPGQAYTATVGVTTLGLTLRGEQDATEACVLCGKETFMDASEVIHHADVENPDGIDYDADADHVAINEPPLVVGARVILGGFVPSGKGYLNGLTGHVESLNRISAKVLLDEASTAVLREKGARHYVVDPGDANFPVRVSRTRCTVRAS